MYILKGSTRHNVVKIPRKSAFYIKIIIVLCISMFIFVKMFGGNHWFRRRKIVVQNDLLDYNEDKLRSGWPFKITKHYDMYDLRSYRSKPRILSTQNLPGEKGMGVMISKELMELADWYYEYQVNILASDKVAANRSLPDLRNPKCLNIRYPKLLPSVTVIMVVHNEAWSVLLRAIWSVINRSPDDLLDEFILVDDFSDKDHMKEKLDEYLPTVSSKITLVRTEKREGLIRARLIGAEKANGQVLIFLDSNTECSDGWMEPLLSRIASDRSVVVTPRIDNINITTSAYERYNDSAIYGFGWNLYYQLFPLPEREILRNRGDLTAPYRTPVLIGCATAIDREYFFEIGTLDTGMDIWGGEASELSIRVWQCGGAVEIVGCSRVGHYFRPTPFSFNGDKYEIELRNNIRTAEVWMDQYKVYFETLIQPTFKKITGGDVSERFALRQKLKCKGFRWYLQNVFPESVMSIGPEIIGQIQKFGSKYCIDRLGRGENKQIGIYSCHGNGYNQGFSYQKNHQIVFPSWLCLGRARKENFTEFPSDDDFLKDPELFSPEVNTENHVVLIPCNSTNGDKWTYSEAKNQILHHATNMCLATDGWLLVIERCNPKEDRQKWKITSFEEYKRSLVLNMLNIH